MSMPLNSSDDPWVDWRLELLRSAPDKQTTITCAGDILDTLFFSDDAMPFRNPQVAIAGALSAYWKILERSSRIFTPNEWRVLSAQCSPFSRGERAGMLPAEAVASVENEYPGDRWNAELLSIKAMLPKIAALSDTDFAAVNAILSYVGNLSSDDPLFTMSRKLPALKQGDTVSV